MIEVDHGEYQDPWRGERPMTEAPWLHPTCIVKDTRMGTWTMVGSRAARRASTAIPSTVCSSRNPGSRPRH
jgi:hypothetical protein